VAKKPSKDPAAKKLATASVTTAKKTGVAKTLGSKGGKKGGPARAAVLTASQRSKIAAEGGKARWKSSADINKETGTSKAHTQRKPSK